MFKRWQGQPTPASKPTPEPVSPVIQWMMRGDMPQVLEIEARLVDAWTEGQLLELLGLPNVAGLVSMEYSVVQGFMIYGMYPGMIRIERIAVHPSARRRGVASGLIRRMQSRATPQRNVIATAASEDRTDVHLLLRSCGFRSPGVIRGEPRDLYYFEWQRNP